jgi:alpha-L-rhamnosidase
MLVGDLVIWLYEDLAGIQSDPEIPAYQHIIMRPHPVGDLKSVHATHRSPYGLIVSDWSRNAGTFDWQIEVPVNTTATVFVPARSSAPVFESGKIAGNAEGVKFLRWENGCAVFDVGSGKYHFVSK